MAKAKKKTTIILIVLAVVILAGTIAMLVINRRKKLKNESIVDSVTGAVSSAVTVGYKPESFPLKKGMYGDKVKAMQYALKHMFYGIGTAGVDGKFGPDTLAAVRGYFNNPTKTEVSELEWKPFYTIYSVNNNLPNA